MGVVLPKDGHKRRDRENSLQLERIQNILQNGQGGHKDNGIGIFWKKKLLCEIKSTKKSLSLGDR